MLELKQLVTHYYDRLKNTEKAFQMAGRTYDDNGKLVLKVVITNGGK